MDKRRKEREKVKHRRLKRAEHIFSQMSRLRFTREHVQVVFRFTTEELGLEKPLLAEKGKVWPADYCVDFPYTMKKRTDGKTWKEHYRDTRAKALEEYRANTQTSIVVPDAYNPDGVSTIDLDAITTAQVEVDEHETQ